MAVVWLILQGIGWILVALVVLLVVALLVPVTVELCYERSGFSAALRVLAVRILLYPRPPKKSAPPKKQAKSRKKKKTVTAGDERPKAPETRVTEPVQSAESPPASQSATDGEQEQPSPVVDSQQQQKETAAPAPEKTLGQTMEWILAWVRTGGQILRRVLEGFRIHHIRIYLPIHRSTAADTALAVGAVQAGLGAAFGGLQNFLDLRPERLDIAPDYTGEHQGEEHFSCKITSHLIIMVITAIWALKRLKQEKLI